MTDELCLFSDTELSEYSSCNMYKRLPGNIVNSTTNWNITGFLHVTYNLEKFIFKVALLQIHIYQENRFLALQMKYVEFGGFFGFC